jgi:hypothetical protein
MGPEAIQLSVERGGSEGFYQFVCPECLGPVEKRADRKIVALLVSAGVDVSDQRQAATAVQSRLEQVAEELLAPPEPSALPAFTVDDLIEFHYLLEDDDFLRLLTEGR